MEWEQEDVYCNLDCSGIFITIRGDPRYKYVHMRNACVAVEACVTVEIRSLLKLGAPCRCGDAAGLVSGRGAPYRSGDTVGLVSDRGAPCRSGDAAGLVSGRGTMGPQPDLARHQGSRRLVTNGVKWMSKYSELSTYHEYGNIFPMSFTVFALQEPEVRTLKQSLETSLRLAKSVD